MAVVQIMGCDGVCIDIPLTHIKKLKTIDDLVTDAGEIEMVRLSDITSDTLLSIRNFLFGATTTAVDDMNDEMFFSLIRASNYFDFRQLTRRMVHTLAERLLISDSKYDFLYLELKGLLRSSIFFLKDAEKLKILKEKIGPDLDDVNIDEVIEYIKQNGTVDWGLKLSSEKGFLDIVEDLVSEYITDRACSVGKSLLNACSRGHVDVVKRLLRVNHIQSYFIEHHALVSAARSGNIEIVKVLLSDTRVNPAYDYNVALGYALSAGFIDIVKLFLADDRVDPTELDLAILRQAIGSGYNEIVEILFNNKYVQRLPGVAIRDCIKTSILMNGDIELMKRYLVDNRFVQYLSFDNFFVDVCSNGQVEMAKYLLADKRVNPAANNNQAIFETIRSNNPKILELLLSDARIDPNVGDHGFLRLTLDLRRFEVMQVLLDDGRCDPGIYNSAFFLDSVFIGNTKIIQMLLRDGRVDPTVDGNRAIKWALEKNQMNTAKILLEHPLVMQSIDTIPGIGELFRMYGAYRKIL